MSKEEYSKINAEIESLPQCGILLLFLTVNLSKCCNFEELMIMSVMAAP